MSNEPISFKKLNACEDDGIVSWEQRTADWDSHISCVLWPGPGSDNYSNLLQEPVGTNYANYEVLSMQSIFFWIFLNIFPPLWTVENVSCGMLIMQIYLQLSTDWILIIVSCIHTSCLCVLRGISNCSIGCVWRCSLQDGAMCQTARKIMTRMCWKKLCTVWWVLLCPGMTGTVGARR